MPYLRFGAVSCKMRPGSRRVSVRKIFSFFALFLLSGATAGWAYTDFYGVKMRSVSNAKDLVIEQTPDNSLKYAHNADTMDERVRAWGQLGHGVVKITVENGSDMPISTDLTFMEFTLVTTSGDQHELGKPGAFVMPAEITPGKKVTFSPSFGGLRINKADIQMIICSFDMGETKVVLVPWPYTKPVKDRFVNPGGVAEPQKVPVAKKEASTRVEDREKPNPNNFALPSKDRRKKYVR